LNLDKLAHAFGKDRATSKGDVTRCDVVEELDKEHEEQNNDDEEEDNIGVDITQSISVNQSKRKHQK
jgi:hypothetical protein